MDLIATILIVSYIPFLTDFLRLVREFWKDFVGGAAAYWIHHFSIRVWSGSFLKGVLRRMRRNRG